ncbi:hypothetical protein G6F62_008073 [Rhizopus arrhizus]|nr:hypothetical protein G6F23_000675 [Rhizopus arrhizus]KAG0953817.1 hypothetical protein G6F32_003927 [Rhizopus arrhizus]KAG1328613.1 hypothetical protein G6F62_008073 [Rhizopus arrhizus]KAG1382112.1 hypothetical protein G6F61_002564 [Rhizopus arrhizus]KAG1405126.1 hypothetical protein G6F60_003851 [Rhizopus arrhizus]
MICDSPYKEDNSPLSLEARHSIPSYRGNNIENNFNELQRNTKNFDSSNKMKQHWELIESYYVSRLDSLQKEIEQNTIENLKLSKCRDELLREVIRLTERSTELSLKNESLSRIIAEKENKVTAFMYNPPSEPTQPAQPLEPLQPSQLLQRLQQNATAVGVTLKDPSSSDNLPNVTINDDNKPEPSKSEPRSKKEPGLFRQLSLRLSTRKRRQQEDLTQSENTNDHAKANLVIPEAILHPAMVVESPLEKRKGLMFGNDLIEQSKHENLMIPSIITRCIEQVESRGLDVEGIYRKSGSYNQVKDLQEALEENTKIQLSDYDDIAVITSVLKIYLRSLPKPLLSNDFILSPMINNSQERLNKMYNLLHAMPREVYCTTKYLVQHLRRVHENQAINRMPSKNLAVVFGPTLMRFTGDIVIGNEEKQTHEMINTVDFIIMQSHILFADYYP